MLADQLTELYAIAMILRSDTEVSIIPNRDAPPMLLIVVDEASTAPFDLVALSKHLDEHRFVAAGDRLHGHTPSGAAVTVVMSSQRGRMATRAEVDGALAGERGTR